MALDMKDQGVIYEPIQNMPWLAEAWQQWLQLRQRLGHAYLFSGSKGIGLEDFAKQVAHLTMCRGKRPEHACDECHSCHLFITNQHPDFFELKRLEGKKEIAVDQVRELTYKLNETSHQGGYKVVWVDGVEYLNQSAFNALLKNLEEPADHTLFLLTTHQIDRLPATIKSRCQLLKFTAPVLPEAVAWMQQQLPQADVALVKRALRLNWGAPLDAREWINEGVFKEDQQWKSDLNDIQSGRQTVTKAVESWLKWTQPERVFDYFYQWTVSAARSVVYSQDCDVQAVNNPKLQNWLRFQHAVLNAKQQWLANANKELVLENLCLEWLSIQQSEDPLQTVFNNKIMKGLLA